MVEVVFRKDLELMGNTGGRTDLWGIFPKYKCKSFSLNSSDTLPISKFQNADGYNQSRLEREAKGVGNCDYCGCCCDTHVLGHSIWGVHETYKWPPQENVEVTPERSRADAGVPEGKFEEGWDFEEAGWDFWEAVTFWFTHLFDSVRSTCIHGYFFFISDNPVSLDCI